MPRAGRPYGLKNQGIVRTKVSVEGQRAILAFPELARRVAKGETTKLIRGFRQKAAGLPGDGANLKEGIAAMARDRIKVDDSTMYRLGQMDEDVLAEMYNGNNLTFEVFFNYEGFQKTKEGAYIDYSQGQKLKDVDFLINEYNRYAASTGRQTV